MLRPEFKVSDRVLLSGFHSLSDVAAGVQSWWQSSWVLQGAYENTRKKLAYSTSDVGRMR
jgi:hypothetical protein